MKHNLFHYFLTFLFLLFKNLILSLIWIALGGVGYLVFQSKKSPIDIIIGLPLILLCIGLLINNIHTAFLALFSPKYNQAFCPFCN